jgi:hypothetical protein
MNNYSSGKLHLSDFMHHTKQLLLKNCDLTTWHYASLIKTQPNPQHQARWCSGNARDLYSGDVRFESRPPHWLSRWRSFVVFLSPCRKIQGIVLRLCQDRFLSNSFQFTNDLPFDTIPYEMLTAVKLLEVNKSRIFPIFIIHNLKNLQ